jgi:ubiquinone/menaquinone biosynthesis C-methylase UbiE
MESTRPSFARDPATAAYYDQRASEYDEWYEDLGQYAPRSRPGWHDDVAHLVSLVSGLAGARTLDVACGTGFLTRHLQGTAVGLDQSRRMVEVATERLPHGSATIGDALRLPFAGHSFDRVLTAHFYGHLPPEERRTFLSEARRVGRQLVVVDSAWRPGGEAEQWQWRVLNDGSRHRVYKRYLRPEQLASEIGGRVLWSGTWFVVAGRS